MRAGWPQVSLEATTALAEEQPVAEMAADATALVRATLRPGALTPEMLAVELVYGQDGGGEPAATRIVPMRMTGARDGAVTYEAELGSIDSGAVTYGVRVRPQHPGAADPVRHTAGEMGVTGGEWAKGRTGEWVNGRASESANGESAPIVIR